ncbi:MAG TPA: cobalt ABC transporter ATP-binding protein [Elusimicrobia bacterium]|jgi:energy-coupling factor transport system ATP-binding protein|nr:cobalt ABC transporter ATP-binding protein [Elusimicrobiota bacterium]
MHLLEIKDLSFTYQNSSSPAVKKINFSVKENEFIILMGKSGAGKSTLAKCLTSIIPQFQKGNYSGKITIENQEIKNVPVYEIAQKIGLLLQDFEVQLFSTNVILEIAFGLENFSLARAEMEKRISETLKTVGLENYLNRDPLTLSGGEKQRLALASILALKPKILILDEPTTDLDPIGKKEIFALLKNLTKQGLTIIVIDHETDEILNADQIIIFNASEIVSSGNVEQLISQSEFLEKNGIRPAAILTLFQKLNLLTQKNIPKTVNDACHLLVENSYQTSEEKYTLLTKEEKKEKNLLFQIKNLEFTYPNVPAGQILKGLNFEIYAGEFLAIVGVNGSGKTTFIKHLNRLFTPTKGEIIYQNKNLKNYKIAELAKDIGYVFQNPDNQIFATTVKEEIVFGLKNLSFPHEEIEKGVKEVLKTVNLEGCKDKDPFILTKGEKQRLSVASVLVTQPKIIILDEPTTGLDYLELRSLMNLLKELNQKGHTIIMVTHTMWLVAEYAKRAIVLKEGEIVFNGSVRQLFSEKNIENWGLALPPLIELSQMFGKTLLSVDEFLFCLNKSTDPTV